MTTRSTILATVALLCATSAGAQSLEETYANLCSDATAAKTEACVALRQALVAKLRARGD